MGLTGSKSKKKDKGATKEQFKSLYFLSTPLQEITTSSANVVLKVSGDPWTKYIQLKDIESGTTGSVSKVLHKETSIQRALKVIKIKDNPKFLGEAFKEIAVLKNLDHPNIEKIYEYFYVENNNISIVFELIEGKELFSKLQMVKHFREREVAMIMIQIFSSIKLTHDSGIVHRDIKAENILVQDEKNLFVKLIDYGSCEVLTSSKLTCSQKVGTPSYVAPEIINGEEYDYGCDMWSLGVLMYYLLSGQKPFAGLNEEETYNFIKNKEPSFKERVWENISDECKTLIKSLLVKKRKNRININQALKSDWIRIQRSQHIDINLHNAQFLKDKIIPNIKVFKNINQIQLLALFYFVHNQIDYNKNEEVLQITREFIYFDQDKDGKLSEEELSNLFLEGGIRKEELNRMVGDIWHMLGDSKGKFLFYEGFIVLSLSNKKALINDKNIQKLFMLLDPKKTMKINFEDLRVLYEGSEELEKKTINPIVWENFYKKLGMANGQAINYGEFCQIVKSIEV